MAAETTSSEEEQEFPVAGSYGPPRVLGVGGGSRTQAESPMDGRAMRRSSRGSFTRASLEDLLSIDPEAYQSSVWLGTEDGWCVTHRHMWRKFLVLLTVFLLIPGSSSFLFLLASTCTSPQTTFATVKTA